ncbi:MAG: glycosyltransferase [Candidatus Delongbacteria bacterium]|nr:glycosyltransferase [Candidatus Delongbacteria bacterium]
MPLKIAALVTTFPRFEHDTEVPWLREICHRLIEAGVDLNVIAPSYEGLAGHRIGRIPVFRYRYFFRRWENLTHNEGAPNKIHKLSYKLVTPFYIMAGIGATFFRVMRLKPDLLHVHWPFPTTFTALLPHFLCGRPYILHFYGAELLLARQYPFVKLFLRYFIRHAAAVIAISEFTAAAVREILPVNPVIIPYGAALMNPPESIIPDRRDSDRFRVLFVGRLIERKGVDYLIRAVSVLAQRDFPIQLDIVGSGSEEEHLRHLISQLGAESYIYLHGRISEERKNEFYRNCHVFVLPSIIDHKGDTEGLGVVLLEAYMFEKPVIAGRVGGIPDVVRHQHTGLLVPEKSSDALVEAILAVHDKPEWAGQLGRQGRVFAMEYFDWNRITRGILDVYQSVLNPEPGNP